MEPTPDPHTEPGLGPSIRHRIRLRALALLRQLESLDLPDEPQAIARHTRALMALERLFARLDPPPPAETTDSEPIQSEMAEAWARETERAEAVLARAEAVLSSAPRNRHERRRAQALTREKPLST